MAQMIIKEKNVINLLILVCLFFNSRAFSQTELKGIYYKNNGLKSSYNTYTFLSDGIFEYNSESDLGAEFFGKGHYKITNDTLVLNYDLTSLRDKSYHKSKEYYNKSDSIAVKINVYDFNLKPLTNSIHAWSYPLYKETEVNKLGELFFKFKKHKEKVAIHLVGEEIEQYVIYLLTDKNYEIDVFMKKIALHNYPKLLKDQITKIPINEFLSGYLKK
ncbi:hypothetical protein EV195_101304 [Tenacibaculum skagerrakense]|uniref:Uncharacterized protein n=1 Tax=Tenacibaculum skagerrakense TaxID=186571 RepID=A0A4R2P2G4_9FLAO|nr:hypothetical protein [Tenacibaculum skagerrakense]TCP28144.1 hypothetical protein EV195_101304 [Tenacibaculum skagerrakense]